MDRSTGFFGDSHSTSHLIATQKDGKVGYLDSDGNVVIDFRFVGLEGGIRSPLFAFNDGRAVVLLPRDGKTSSPISFQQLDDVINRIRYTIYKWVVINESGDIIPTEQYDRILPFRDGLAIASRDNRLFLLDTEGKEHPLPPEFVLGEVAVGRSDDGRVFRAVFRNEGKTGYFKVRD